MATPAKFFKEAVEELEKILGNDPELQGRVINLLGEAFDAADKASGSEKLKIQLKAIFKIIGSERVIGEWFNRHFEMNQEKLNLFTSIKSLVKYYEYRYFRSKNYVKADKYKDDDEIERTTFTTKRQQDCSFNDQDEEALIIYIL